MNIKELKNYLQEYEISCSDEQLNLLNLFMKCTLETNVKFNLTAITNEEQFVEKMIFDSALALYDLDISNKKIIDIGTGAGYPGMVLKILEPKADVYLLDSTAKKIKYLEEFAMANNIQIQGVVARAEDYARSHIEAFDYATARAVAALNVLLELIVPLLKVGGTFIAMKGAGYEKEIQDSQNALKKLNCRIESIEEFELPESKESRAIIRIVKEKPTNKKYPRQYNEIKKLPL